MKSGEQITTKQQSESCGCHGQSQGGSSGQCHQTIAEHLQQAVEMYRKAEQAYENNKEKAAYYEHLGLGHIMWAMKCVKKSLITCAKECSSENSTQESPESQITA